MIKKILLSLAVYGFTCSASMAQTPQDSVAIANIKWQSTKLKRGVVWKSARVELYGSPKSINIVEVKNPQKHHVNIAYCVDTLLPTSILCSSVGAIAGVNASFFDMKNGNSVDYMRVDGKIIHKGREGSANSNAAIVFNGGKLRICKKTADSTSTWVSRLEGNGVLVAGPMLVENGKCELQQETGFNTTRHPRTCAAITADGRLMLVTIDGRHGENAEGMSTTELAFFLKILGAKDAMNFDGGGSTAMYVKGRGEKGIVNYPSDNKVFDHLGERKVANVVYVK